ncbi:hypothetical protein CLV46_0075 [Diaminobutyricimonas aerilata]|uniref:ABC transporter n=1 Tax=Diaminobutyricimonas aerilata TaxID=1162967 RepID=A0A2M9CF74_9MICO|nr:ABC transporter [Diaminobutyricimonas aerilata]PJJ70553.1 hypothetical protein CLV46_0075 [Diaminobutyricimonas aerilata]
MKRLTPALLALAAVTLTSACATTTPAPADTPSAGHGYIPGAEEMPEPQLRVITVDDDGSTASIDLLTGDEVDVADLGAPGDIVTDGRFVFATTDAGVEVLDSGVWTRPHGDHSHYYRADSRRVGVVKGDGAARVASDRRTVVIAFDDEAVVLEAAALADGGLGDPRRVDLDPGAVAAPFGDHLVVGESDAVRVQDADGAVVAEAPCAAPAGSFPTRAGLVIGCAEGALLVTEGETAPVVEPVPYPAPVVDADRARDFAARADRPSVAAPAGITGVWLLDARERAWMRIPTEAPVIAASAVGDDDETVLAVDATGRLLVLDGLGGTLLAATEPLVAESVADPALAAGVTLEVDAQRAYLNDPAGGRVLEIDYRDGGRVAREFRMPHTPLFLAEVGR